MLMCLWIREALLFFELGSCPAYAGTDEVPHGSNDWLAPEAAAAGLGAAGRAEHPRLTAGDNKAPK